MAGDSMMQPFIRARAPCLAFVLALLLVFSACRKGPEPRYGGPPGEGRLIYEPGRGIVRQGSVVSGDEQSSFARVQAAFNEGRLEDCINLSLDHSRAWPEGARVVEAILLRVRARLESRRSEDSALPRGVALEQIMFLYLAPDEDARLKALLARESDVARYARDFRQVDFAAFIDRLEPDALALNRGGNMAAAVQDCRTLINYYLPVQELREFRVQTAELTRNTAWLAYAAGDFEGALNSADELLAMNPPPTVKGDTLFIRGHALRRNGAHAFAADAFERLFRGASLRDTDTRWRPWALAWWINQIMATSKGPMYDQTPYERVLELIGEYELYRVENPGIPGTLQAVFTALARQAYDVLIRRDYNAADTYDRLGRQQARDHYLRNAEALERERDKRLARLRGEP